MKKPQEQATGDTRIRRAFIVRPFGRKKGIDFDAVEKKLIDKALARLGIRGRTTMEIATPGNIRTDMFNLLVSADIVIADISIHNANVFYELGVRHSLRRAATVLIRGRKGGDKIPFDLLTDRFFAYDEKEPGKSIDGLVDVLYAAIVDASSLDSPVFRSLPDMIEQKPESFLPVPQDFLAAVAEAEKNKRPGDLALLAEEAENAPWARPALRAVGRAQFAVRALEAARETWEMVQRFDAADVETNTLLATIHQKLDNLGASDVAIDRVLAQPTLSNYEQAEAHALKGRNAKARWIKEWRDEADREKSGEIAAASGWLAKSYEHYSDGFQSNLQNYYAGINALAMLVIRLVLAERYPHTMAEDERKQLLKRRDSLTHAVQESIRAGQQLARRAGRSDLWADISAADLALYRGEPVPEVKTAYRRVAGISPFQVEAVRAQLDLLARLGIREEAALAALETLPAAERAPQPPHVLLFTGHRIDEPRRPRPRFPPTRKAVDTARREIGKAIDEALARHGTHLVGMSGAASGGDILFQQECRSRGIATTVFLALPQKKYAAASVSPAGPQWTRDFYDLLAKTPYRELQQSKDLPPWLAHRENYTIWQRNNLWMLHNALAHGHNRVTLLALWDGEKGDGAGGTEEMVRQIASRGGEVIPIGQRTLFRSAATSRRASR